MGGGARNKKQQQQQAGKAKGGGGKGGAAAGGEGDGEGGDEEQEQEEEEEFSLEEYRTRMSRALEQLQRDLGGVRTSANPRLLDNVHVESAKFGTRVPLRSLATVVVRSPQLLVVEVYDKEDAEHVVQAIIKSPLALQARLEKGEVLVAVPRMTMEMVEKMTKMAKDEGETAKVEVRRVRHVAMEELKKRLKKAATDERRRREKEVRRGLPAAPERPPRGGPPQQRLHVLGLSSQNLFEGRIVGCHAAPYDTQYPHPGWAEQRPEDWWTALGAAVRGALAEAAAASEVVTPGQVAAMCVDTTCCTVVALGADDQPLRPALLWMDMRSAAQAARVAAADDPALQVNGGGRGPVSAEWMVPKSMWLAENEPAVYAAAATICEYQDYINLQLTGRRCASANNMSVRWHYSTERGLPLSLLSKLGLSDLAAKWPVGREGEHVLAPGEIVGGLTAAAAAHLGGLPEGLPVAQGGADAFIGMIGLGVIEPGQMALLTGSSHLHLGVVSSELHGPGFFGTYRDAVLPGCHVIEGGQTSTGSVVAWFRRTLCPPGLPYSVLDEEAAAVPPGCEGLVALDHFQGNRTPHTDPLSRGALAGLTLKHGRGHVFRALMESVAAGTTLILRTMQSAGYLPSRLTVAGGATRSPLWLQIHADMSGLPLRLTKCAEAPMLGCAILAAVAAGLYDNVPAAAASMVAVDRDVLPDPAATAAYRQPLRRYAALYPALAPLFHGKHDGPAAAADAGQAQGQGQGQGRAVSEAAATAMEVCAEGAAAATNPVAPASSAAVEEREPHRSDCAAASTAAGAAAAAAGGSGGGVLVAPSILAADFAALGAAVSAAEAAGADWVHVDVFDGSWEGCPNFTIGPAVVAALRRGTKIPLDCHVALRDPARYLPSLALAGTSGFTFHWEVVAGPATGTQPEAADTETQTAGPSGSSGGSGGGGTAAVADLARRIRAAGMRAGVALAPDTPLPDELVELAKRGKIDMVLAMTVAPGFGGQSFKSEVLQKVQALRAACPELLIQVDGGINAQTAEAAVAAGANVLVAGTFLYGHRKGLAAGVAELRAAAAAAVASGQAQPQ